MLAPDGHCKLWHVDHYALEASAPSRVTARCSSEDLQAYAASHGYARLKDSVCNEVCSRKEKGLKAACPAHVQGTVMDCGTRGMI